VNAPQIHVTSTLPVLLSILVVQDIQQDISTLEDETSVLLEMSGTKYPVRQINIEQEWLR
jgi:hypothetical protein